MSTRKARPPRPTSVAIPRGHVQTPLMTDYGPVIVIGEKRIVQQVLADYFETSISREREIIEDLGGWDTDV